MWFFVTTHISLNFWDHKIEFTTITSCCRNTHHSIQKKIWNVISSQTSVWNINSSIIASYKDMWVALDKTTDAPFLQCLLFGAKTKFAHLSCKSKMLIYLELKFLQNIGLEIQYKILWFSYNYIIDPIGKVFYFQFMNWSYIR